jgi:hypothetical protein
MSAVFCCLLMAEASRRTVLNGSMSARLDGAAENIN